MEETVKKVKPPAESSLDGSKKRLRKRNDSGDIRDWHRGKV